MLEQENITGSPTSSSDARLALILLFSTTVLWGTLYIVTKVVTENVPIFFFLGTRHLIAVLAFAPLFRHLRHLDWKTTWMAIVTGGANFLLNAFQVYGLQSISPSKSAFLTGFSVVLVPFLAVGILKRPIRRSTWLAAGISMAGIGVITLTGSASQLFQFGVGELFTLIGAFFAAIQIVYTERFAPKVDLVAFSILQLALVSGLSFACSSFVDSWRDLPLASPTFWAVILWMGIAVTTFPFMFQNFGQRHQSSTRVAVIFTLEPVFATLFGVLLGGEQLAFQLAVGGGLILFANVIATRGGTVEKQAKKPTNHDIVAG
ncbi:MAG TPA: DMT family transporter [Candidatus Lokiarchaeia archaeon]|nr:DMT family transporter [Candidatus Lokiarchaeia archaeon]